MNEVILYDYWRSSASYRVRIALALAGIVYKTVSVDLLKAEHKQPEHVARNPQGLLPALFIDGHLFTQSLAIIEYLSETRPALNIMPQNPIERARVRTVAHAIAMDIHPVCNLSVVNEVVQRAGHASDTREQWMAKFIGEGLLAVEKLLTAAGPYAFGAAPTLADICIVPQIYNARRWKVDISTLPKLITIDKNLNQIPAFASATPEMARPNAA